LGIFVLGLAGIVSFAIYMTIRALLNDISTNNVAAQEPTSTVDPAQAKAEPANTPKGFCGETEVWNILVLGSDAADLYYPQGADLTRVVRVDFPNKKAAVYAFSRDLWVDVSSLDFTNPSITSIKLGMAFYEARERSTKSDPKGATLDGISAMNETLEANFTLTSDHYIAIDLDKLPAMVDTIGGLPINIPADLTDPLSGITFKAGEQTLNGIQVATYARAYLDSDLNRIPRNDLVVEALHQKLVDPPVWAKIPKLFLQFEDSIYTDFSPEQVKYLRCLMREVEVESIIQDGVKAEWTSPGPEGSLLWDKENVLNRLRELGMIP
jgi:LCP family protein required for cell wall assembly